ncbi:hypothetical protein F4X73_12220 [Candidatus Poribacteria bacterium]|nr:hypothetical protein [Candidatus Poribacteria bacterium]MYB65448.1 hypothetical protein [Candidatus Poribacteria bacterium]
MKSRISTLGYYSLALSLLVVALFSGNSVSAADHTKHKTHNVENADVLNVKLHTEPDKITAEKPVSLMFHLTDAKGEPFTDLMVHHDRILHILIVSENLQTIGHIHPEDFESRDMLAELEGVYTVQFTFPYSGRYIVAIDAMTTDAEYTKHLYVDVTGDKEMPEFSTDIRREKMVVGYTEEGGDRFTKSVSITEKKGASKYMVKMSVPDKIKVGEMVHITYHFTHEGKPVTDLVPFLDAPMHFAIVSNRLDGILHTHGTVQMGSMHDKLKKDSLHANRKMREKTSTTGHEHKGITPDKFGPTVMLMTTFPEAGFYQIFGQVKHGDQILFPTFMVKVEE